MKQKERFYILDLLRGLAVLLMILAHAVYFFHVGDNSFLLGIEKIGNTFCFTAFLLVSGAASYIAYLREPEIGSNLFKKVGHRILLLLVSYYTLAVVILLPVFSERFGLAKVWLFFDILSFRTLPSYAEYLPPFIIYALFLLFFPSFLRWMSSSLQRVVLWSLAFYFLGLAIYSFLPAPNILNPWKAFIAGAEGYYRFPILQYFPVYLLGLFWGNRLLVSRGLEAKQKIAGKLLAGAVLLFSASYVLFENLNFSADKIMLRWPPSLVFLLLSLVLYFAAAYVIYLFKRLKKAPLLRDFLLLLGQNAFALFWTHIFVLSIYQAGGGAKVSSLLIFSGLFVFLLLLSIALATFIPFNYRFLLTFIRSSHEEREETLEKEPVFEFGEELTEDIKKETGIIRRFFLPSSDGTVRKRRLIKKRHLLGGVTIGFLLVVFLYPAVLEEYKGWLSSKQEKYWLSDSFGFRQNFAIENLDSFTNLSAGQTAVLKLNHNELVKFQKSEPDGRDVGLYYLQGDDYKKLKYEMLSKWNSFDTTIRFEIPETIAGGKSDSNFYLYYGDPLANIEETKLNFLEPPADYRIVFEKEESHPFALSVSKKWNILGPQFNPKISVNLKSLNSLENPEVNYEIAGTGKTGVLQIASETEFEGTLDLSNLPAGNYTVQATITTTEGNYKSQKASFFISYPLFIAWTHDWEGYDADESKLLSIEKISLEYGLPITHFFNPRIYITNTISKERKEYLTEWVKRRISLGDGYGLHLHMFYDFVESAGVAAKHEPNWGDQGDGYGVPTTAYTTEELEKIIQKALDLLKENNFARPEIYRAGGWFADTNTLQTIENLGFTADSSGRTAYKFGRNQLNGPWSLQAETKPYLPSRTDQNVSSLFNPFNLLEIPNNGADSYAFDEQQMIDRFQKNFKGTALLEANQISYLSHPHWFDSNEQERVKTLFDYIGAYKAEGDFGPIIYTTTNEIADYWQSR